MKRWNNYERGFTVSREVGFIIMEKFPEVSVEWIWFGMTGNLGPDFKKKVAAAELLERDRELAHAALKEAKQRVKELDALRAKKLRPQR